MIALFTNQRDLTTDFVILELQRRSLPYIRVNTETAPKGAATLGFRHRDDWSLALGDRLLRGEDVRAAYFRRPGPPAIDEDINDAGERAYCEAEWGALLKTIYGRLGPRWLSAPAAIMLAEDKPRQLLAALDAGFKIPETVVTNSLSVAETFLKGSQAVAKPLREALLAGEEERVIFTSRVDRLAERNQKSFAAAPVILQREIVKRADVRVTVVKDRVFATAIGSQAYAVTEVDWRRGGPETLDHQPTDLPKAIESRCVQLVADLGLGFGAIDLVWDRDDEFWFLEINPNGQWAWIENRTGQPIAAAIVDELQRIASS